MLSGSVLPCCVNIERDLRDHLDHQHGHDADADDDHDDRIDHRALDLRLELLRASRKSARRVSTSSRLPATSPARTIDTNSSSNSFGCFASASASDEPSLTAVRTSASGALKPDVRDLLDQRAERLGERDARAEQRRHLARERRDLDLLDAAEHAAEVDVARQAALLRVLRPSPPCRPWTARSS